MGRSEAQEMAVWSQDALKEATSKHWVAVGTSARAKNPINIFTDAPQKVVRKKKRSSGEGVHKQILFKHYFGSWSGKPEAKMADKWRDLPTTWNPFLLITYNNNKHSGQVHFNHSETGNCT